MFASDVTAFTPMLFIDDMLMLIFRLTLTPLR